MAKGGSRYGAGRPGYRLKSEHCQRIDIRRWQKGGYLKAGTGFTWQWTCDGEKTGSIGVNVSNGSMRLGYSIEGRDASQTITTTTTPCHYGGWRPWFSCPICYSRAAVLYQRSGRFACRQCQRVSYSTQSGSAIDRVCNRYHRLDAVVMAGKPRWQRWATRNRLLDRYELVSAQFEDVLSGHLSAIGFPG